MNKSSKESTDKDECYTPAEWINHCKNFTGLHRFQLFDWDLATSGRINDHLEVARNWYTREHSFLENSENFHQVNNGKPATFFYQPPYSLNDAFSRQLEMVIKQNPLLYGAILVNNNSDTGWYKRLESLCDWLILPRGRISFLDADFKPRKGNRRWQAIMVRASSDRDVIARQFKAIRAREGDKWTSYSHLYSSIPTTDHSG